MSLKDIIEQSGGRIELIDATPQFRDTTIETMTQDKWDRLSPPERDQLRSDDALTPQLIGLEGWRVEVTTDYGETRRFIVGRSTGWIPIHIELARRDSSGGIGASREYETVRRLYNARGK